MFLDQLTHRLRQPLPGRSAQARFQPELSFGRHFHPPRHDARRAAVMMLLYKDQTGWRLPLVLRPESMLAHAGQIGLPGGMVEPGENRWQAALRELEEELGVPPSQVRSLGRLSSLYVYVSNICVTPWLAAIDTAPRFLPNPAEVAEVLEVPLSHLCDTAWHRRANVSVVPAHVSAPGIHWNSHHIWGATAMMLGELIALLEDLPR